VSDKAKLTKEQAQTIGYFKESDDWTNSSLVEAHAYNPNRWEDSGSPINGMPVDTLIRALYIGYEVEQTPEEQLLQYYKMQKNSVSDDQERTEVAIVRVLEFLKIKVKDINA
jgi:hypothetical protein